MRAIYLDHVSYALGRRPESVAEAAAGGRVRSAENVFREAGFERHCICDEDQTAYDLAVEAVDPLRPVLGRIDVIAYSTSLPFNGNLGSEERFEATGDVKHLADFPASHLQAEFGLSEAFVLGLSQQACTGMLGSIRVARALLCTEPDLDRVLCVTADRFPSGASYEQSYNLVSDGAAACIVSGKPGGYRLLGCHAVTNGSLARAEDDEVVGTYFSYVHLTIRGLLERCGLGIADVDWIVPQNLNEKALRILASLLGFDFERVGFPTLAEIGHVISGDNLINLKALAETGRIRAGEKLLLVMAGYGLNWQTILLEKV